MTGPVQCTEPGHFILMENIWQKTELIEGELKLVCLPGVGGRLWDIVFNGKSLLFQNPDLVDIVPQLDRLDQLLTRSPQFKFPLWGGEKTWVAPDSGWPSEGPHPELDSGIYQILSQDDHHIQMRSEICRASALQIERTIIRDSQASFRIEHSLTNCGTEIPIVGIWSVMMLNRPATISLEHLSNGEPYTAVFGDPQGSVFIDKESLIHRCDKAAEFKTGATNNAGEVKVVWASQNNITSLICSTPMPAKRDEFAHKHNFEVFNSKDYNYCEAERHSPCTALDPGSTIGFCQEFSLSSITADAVNNGIPAQNGK